MTLGLCEYLIIKVSFDNEVKLIMERQTEIKYKKVKMKSKTEEKKSIM